MEITIEMIDELRKRTNVNYSDAKKALEESNGDMVEAIIYLEKNNKTKQDEAKNNSTNIFKKTFKKLNNIKVEAKKNDILEIRLPLLLFLIVSIMLLPLTILAVVIYMFTGYKFELKNNEDNLKSVNDTLEKMSDSIKDLN